MSSRFRARDCDNRINLITLRKGGALNRNSAWREQILILMRGISPAVSLLTLTAVVSLAWFPGTGANAITPGTQSPEVTGTNEAAKASPTQDIQVPPPPFTEGIFPCSQCHADIKTNPQPRKLVDAHDDIVLEHDQEHRWCLDCHNPDNRDVLRLASGKTISFAESYQLCGQCHGDKYRDWKVGVHGKRTGEWNGKKQYLLCVNCHNPHSPHFKSLTPLPPPNKPVKSGQPKGSSR